jgi:hypothetical protein
MVRPSSRLSLQEVGPDNINRDPSLLPHRSSRWSVGRVLVDYLAGTTGAEGAGLDGVDGTASQSLLPSNAPSPPQSTTSINDCSIQGQQDTAPASPQSVAAEGLVQIVEGVNRPPGKHKPPRSIPQSQDESGDSIVGPDVSVCGQTGTCSPMTESGLDIAILIARAKARKACAEFRTDLMHVGPPIKIHFLGRKESGSVDFFDVSGSGGDADFAECLGRSFSRHFLTGKNAAPLDFFVTFASE